MAEARLRPMDIGDLECVLGWRNHPDVRRFMYTRHVITLVEHQRWFDRASRDPANHLMIFEQNGVRAGFVNITQHDVAAIADWGFYLAPDSMSGTGALLGGTALRYAFESLGLHKLCGQALSYNERSIRFHLRLGFQQEGLLRDQHFDGERFYSVICFGLLQEEWRARLRGGE